MQPNSFIRLFSLFVLFSLFPVLTVAQTRQSELQRDLRPRNCAIYGRVTINGQPTANVQVSFFEIPMNWDQPQPIRQTADGSIARTSFKARTDGEGRYQVANLPPGRYIISASSRAFVLIGTQQNNEPKTVTLDAGESRDNVDFALVRGGVITGQVTDSEGRPVIAQVVKLFRVTITPDGQRQLDYSGGNFSEGRTDDRGIYRLYGLPAGRYAVSAGGYDYYSDTAKYPTTYYPNVSDKQQAKILELAAGAELTEINLRLGTAGKTFEAVGRVIETDTGKPIPNINVSSQKIQPPGERTNANDSDADESSSGYTQTDRAGNFRLTGLKRGKYQLDISAKWQETTEFYAEPVSFEITDDNASGVEIKAVRGGTISGVAIIEGSNDPALKSKLKQMMVYAQTERDESQQQSDQPTSSSRGFFKSDGTFALMGIAPGKVAFGVQNFGERSMSVMRIERGGVEIKNSLEIAKGEAITDVRVIFSTGSGVIHGQVQVAGGGRLTGGWNYVFAKMIGSASGANFQAIVDEKGRFEFSSLPSGEYELELFITVGIAHGEYQRQSADKQRITVGSGAEARVTMTYDPNRKPEEER